MERSGQKTEIKQQITDNAGQALSVRCHPLVWFASRRLSLNRELACDDWVLSQCRNRKGYALNLIEFVSTPASESRIAPALFSRPGKLAHRITQIMDLKRRIAPAVSGPGLACVGLITLAGLSVIGCFTLSTQPGLNPRVDTLLTEARTHIRNDRHRASQLIDEALVQASQLPAIGARQANRMHVLELQAHMARHKGERRPILQETLTLARRLNDRPAQARTLQRLEKSSEGHPGPQKLSRSKQHRRLPAPGRGQPVGLHLGKQGRPAI